MEKRGNDEKDSFVDERICGGVNLSDPMKKVKPLNWDDLIMQKNQTEIKRRRITGEINKFSLFQVISNRIGWAAYWQANHYFWLWIQRY